MSRTLTLFLTAVLCGGLVQAETAQNKAAQTEAAQTRATQNKAPPVKVTPHTCGKATVRLEENGFEDPPDRLRLIQGGRAVLSLEDTMVEFQGCRDLTGDGVPEVILAQFTGGAHCCFTHHVYSLTTPPRRLLVAYSAHTEGLEARQLDGGGPLELIGADWRFAYAHGLSFADSPALPLVYSYRGGRYVQDTRRFPAFVLEGTRRRGDETLSGGMALYEYASLLLAGRAAEAQHYLRTLPAAYRTWLENYAPEIRQSLRSAGMDDWPQRAGVPEQGSTSGLGGAFTAPGQQEYLTLIREPGGGASLRLYREQQGRVVGTPALATFQLPAGQTFSEWRWWPGFTVRRLSGRDDAVIEDRTSGSVRYPVYRVGTQRAQVLHNDPLAVATGLLGDLSTVARHVSSMYASTPRTADQRAEVVRRIDAAVARARPWLRQNPRPLDLPRLGSFTVGSVEVSRENAASALVAGTVDVGLTTPDQKDEYVAADRHTFAVFLEKQGGRWVVTKWQLTPRKGEVPNGWKD